MWKVLLVISSVVLLGAAYLANENRKDKIETTDNLNTQKDTLAAREKSLEETNAEIAQLEQSVQMLNDQTETLETEKVDLDTKVVEAKSNLKVQEANLVTIKEKLADAKKLIGNLQEIASLQKEMVQIRTQIEETEIEVTQVEGATAAAQVDRDRFEKVAAELEALRKDQEAGLIRGEFQSTIKKAYNQWGFVIVNGGNDQGVVNRAQLDVYRRGQPICKLLVTSVEPAESAADIIPGSLAPGQTVQVGDTVVRTVRSTTPAVIPAEGGEAPADPAAPADGEAPAADPFGGGMGGGMDAAAPADPFGAAPAEPAPEGGADPFGGGAMEEKKDDAEAPADPFQ